MGAFTFQRSWTLLPRPIQSDRTTRISQFLGKRESKVAAQRFENLSRDAWGNRIQSRLNHGEQQEFLTGFK